MAQRIVLVCDQHQAENQEDVPAVTWRIGVQVPGGRFATYDVDACPDHAKPFLELAQYLSDVGRPVKGSHLQARDRSGDQGEPEADRTCPTCGFVSVNRTAMRTHLRAQHNQSLAEAQGTAVEGLECPECHRSFDAPQGLAAHRRRSHGVAGRGSSTNGNGGSSSTS